MQRTQTVKRDPSCAFQRSGQAPSSHPTVLSCAFYIEYFGHCVSYIALSFVVVLFLCKLLPLLLLLRRAEDGGLAGFCRGRVA